MTFHDNGRAVAPFDAGVIQHQFAGIAAASFVGKQHAILAADDAALAGSRGCTVEPHAITIGAGAFDHSVLIEVQLSIARGYCPALFPPDDAVEHLGNAALVGIETLVRLQTESCVADDGTVANDGRTVIQAHRPPYRVVGFNSGAVNVDGGALRRTDIFDPAASIDIQRRVVGQDISGASTVDGQLGLMIQLPIIFHLMGANGP